MSTTAQVLNLLIAPAALISANAIILRFNYERLAQVIARVRHFDETFEEIMEKKASMKMSVPLKKLYDRQIRIIKHQAPLIISSGEKLQIAIYCYELSILSLGFTGLVAGLIFVIGSSAFPIALVCCGIGMILLVVGIIYSLKDVVISLGPITHEFNEMIEFSMDYQKRIFEV